MNWTDNELSEMATKAEANEAFAYQDSFWGEMEALLPSKKKRIWPLILAFAIPVLGASAILLNWPVQNLETSHVAKTMDFDYKRITERNLGNSSIKTTISNKIAANSVSEEIINNIDERTPNVEKANVNSSSREIIAEAKSPKSLTKSNIDKPIEESMLVNTNNVNSSNALLIETVENGALISERKSSTDFSTSILSVSPLEGTSELIAQKELNIDKLAIAKFSGFSSTEQIQPAMLKYQSKRRYYSAFGELGVGLGETYATNQIGHTENVSLSAGARLTKNKIFVQAGIGVEVEKAALELTERSIEYGYGSKTLENRMSYKQMYRLAFPVNVGYEIGKHTLQLGATASYLMSTKMRYAYLENENIKRNEIIYGEKKGWNSTGLRMNVGYGFNILPSTTLGANFQVQLINQLEKSWNTNENKLPISGQVFIRRTIR